MSNDHSNNEEKNIARLHADLALLKRDPKSYVDMMTDRIDNGVDLSSNYFSRHRGWLSLGDVMRALSDLDHAISLEEDPIGCRARGRIFMSLGRYHEALADFAKAESLADDEFDWISMWGPLYQATCHAALGQEAETLAEWARLKEDHWTPGLDNTPAGDKAEVLAELKRRLAAAR